MTLNNQTKCIIPFSKYSGCGNDFILIDNREDGLVFSSTQISKLCYRKTGIGADGMIFIESSSKADFRMRIFNADGSEAEMCGNGIRCMADFLVKKGLIKSSCQIETLKLVHQIDWKADTITVGMGAPTDVSWDVKLFIDNHPISMSFLDTGVPHAVIFCDNCRQIDINQVGAAIRHHPHFSPKGTNVNFVQVEKDHILIRTYERGVEGETEACGTGATAAAIAAAKTFQLPSPIPVKFLSGESLSIDFTIEGSNISHVTMSGRCHHIFDGAVEID